MGANLRALGIEQHGRHDARFLTGCLEGLEVGQVPLLRSMGEIKPGNIHTGFQEFDHDFFGVGSWSEGTDNFSFFHVTLLRLRLIAVRQGLVQLE